MYPINGITACCPRAVIGHAAAPPSRVMNLRRCMCSLNPKVTPYHIGLARCAAQQNQPAEDRFGSFSTVLPADAKPPTSAATPIAAVLHIDGHLSVSAM